MFTKDKYFSLKILLISIILTLFVNYPNMGMLSWMLSMMEKAKHTGYIYFFGFRLLYFCALIFVLLKYNLSTTSIKDFKGRLFHNFIIVFIAFGIYALIAKYAGPKFDAFSSMILFQFLVTWLVGSLIGHISHLYVEKLKKSRR